MSRAYPWTDSKVHARWQDGAPGGRGRHSFCNFGFNKRFGFGFCRSYHLQVEGEHWELGSCQTAWRIQLVFNLYFLAFWNEIEVCVWFQIWVYLQEIRYQGSLTDVASFSELKEHMWVYKSSWEWYDVLGRDRPTYYLRKSAKEELVQLPTRRVRTYFLNKSSPFPLRRSAARVRRWLEDESGKIWEWERASGSGREGKSDSSGPRVYALWCLLKKSARVVITNIINPSCTLCPHPQNRWHLWKGLTQDRGRLKEKWNSHLFSGLLQGV